MGLHADATDMSLSSSRALQMERYERSRLSSFRSFRNYRGSRVNARRKTSPRQRHQPLGSLHGGNQRAVDALVAQCHMMSPLTRTTLCHVVHPSSWHQSRRQSLRTYMTDAPLSFSLPFHVSQCRCFAVETKRCDKDTQTPTGAAVPDGFTVLHKLTFPSTSRATQLA